MRLLLVEDERALAQALDDALKEEGWVVDLAADGREGLRMALVGQYDVVVLDIMLPLMNGYAVVKTLRERPQFAGVHFAAVTGWGQDEDRRRAQDAGFDSHFTKPLAPAMLEALLTSLSHRAQ